MTGSPELFVGRRLELEVLRAALEAAGSGQGRLVLLSGEPGIGKTRTAAELAADAGRDGARLMWGRCHEEAGAPPYWPWAQILRAAVQGLDIVALRHDLGAGAADIAEIIPEIRDRLSDLEPPSPARDPAEARFRMFDSLTRFLVSASRRQPLVIVLDDLHWADVPSLRFLEFLAPEIGDSRLLLIGTYRENELSRQHPASDALAALARVPHVSRVRLSGLDSEEVRHFIAFAAEVVPPAWVEIWDTLGMRATRSDDIVLDGVFVPQGYIARIVPAGTADAFVLGIFAWALLEFGNIYHAIAQRAMDLAVPAVKAKKSLAVSRTMAYHPEIQRMIAEMALALDPIGPHLERVAEDWSNGVDHGATWPSRIVSAKHHAVEACWQIVDKAMEVPGGAGMFRGNELEQLFRDAGCGRFHPANTFLVHEIVAKTALGIDLGEQPRWG